MLKRDYILAMIEDFFQAIQKLVQQREEGNTDSSLKLIQRSYGSLHLDENQRLHEDLDKLAKTLELDEKPPLPFMELLAGMMMEESYLTEGKEDILLGRAQNILEYVEQRDDTFSFDRKEKIAMIKSMLAEARS